MIKVLFLIIWNPWVSLNSRKRTTICQITFGGTMVSFLSITFSKLSLMLNPFAFLVVGFHGIFLTRLCFKLFTQFNLTVPLLLHWYLEWRQMALNHSFVKRSCHHLPCGNQKELILVIAKPNISENSYFWIYGQLELILWVWRYHQKVEFCW